MTRPGLSHVVAEKLARVSGVVYELEADVDFLRARLPIAHLDELTRWPQLTSLQLATAFEPFALDQPEPFQGPVDSARAEPAGKPGVPPTAYTPRDNPYTQEASTQALQFKAAHPTF